MVSKDDSDMIDLINAFPDFMATGIQLFLGFFFTSENKGTDCQLFDLLRGKKKKWIWELCCVRFHTLKGSISRLMLEISFKELGPFRSFFDFVVLV